MAAVTFTATQLLTRAFQLVGVIGEADTMSAAQAQDGLAILNGFVDTLQTQRLTIPASTRQQFAFTANTSTYAIGPTGVWATTRPIGIDYAAVINTTATTPFEIALDALDDQSYAAIVQKTLTAPFPTQYYYNATTPNGSIFFWPTPTDAATYAAVLYVATYLDTFSSLTASTSLAPGYYRMLYYNLAVELALAWQKPTDPKIDKYAAQSLGDVKRNNLSMVDLITPAALPGVDGLYNVYSDSNY